jgi:hypothetical protein
MTISLCVPCLNKILKNRLVFTASDFHIRAGRQFSAASAILRPNLAQAELNLVKNAAQPEFLVVESELPKMYSQIRRNLDTPYKSLVPLIIYAMALYL